MVLDLVSIYFQHRLTLRFSFTMFSIYWSIFDPSWIQYKYKLHVLSHIKEDIRRFGPAVLFATEIFECWTAVFRLCSVLSNHQAPSRDIANTLADMERFKHQVSRDGGKQQLVMFKQAATSGISFHGTENFNGNLGGWTWTDLHLVCICLFLFYEQVTVS